MPRSRLNAIRPTCLALAVSLLVSPVTPTVVAQETSPAASTSPTPVKTSGGKRHEAEIRLNFLSKPWPEVLNQVAADTGSTLVMPEVPPGKFSRTDFGKHSREEAVRILNRDLQKTGYRLLIKDDILEVISITKDRPEYPRPTYRDMPRVAVEGQDASRPMPQNGRQDINSVAPAGSVIQRVGHEVPAEPEAKQQPSIALSPVNRSALEIARQIHVAFQSRSRLENKGPNGLPAFVVDHFEEEAKTAGQALFTLEIDTERNELLLTAPPAVQMGLKQLVSKLDVNPLQSKAGPALVAGNGETAEVGKRLVGPLRQLAQLREEQGNLPVAPAPPAGQAAPAAPASGNQRSAVDVVPNVPGAEAELPAILGRLQGDVTIQSLDELDLLIIEGNEKDVEAVMKVIGSIERLAKGSLPEFRLLHLQFVDSQSMAALLNDVYTKLSELRTNNAQRSQAAVRVVPIVTPNAVLIIAPANSMPSIEDLAEQLDQPIDPQHEVQIFRLKHAVASSVVETLQNFYGDTPVGLGTRLKVAADARTNSVIVQAMPRDLSEIAEFIKGMDSEQAGSANQLRIIPLKSANAIDMAQFLNTAVQSALSTPPAATAPGQTGAGGGGFGGAGQTNSSNQTARSVVLEFLTEEGQNLVRSGLLNDVRFNAEPRTNNLVITAPEQTMPLLLELVAILDRPSAVKAEIKVYPLENADASDAVTLLNGIFNQGQNQNQGQGGGQNAQQQALGVEIVGTEGSSSNLIPLRFYADVRTNSVVAIGGPAALTMVHGILIKLDSTNPQNRKISTYKLRNSPAADVAASINEFLASQRELATIDPDRVSTSQLLEQEIIVTAEPISNQLIISATPSYLPQIMELAKKLDAVPPQVLIQAMIVEVELENTDEFGVELGFQDPVLFGRSSIAQDAITTIQQTIQQPGQTAVTNTSVISQQGTPGFAFNNQPLGNNIGPGSRSGHVGTQGLTNFAVGRVNNDLGYGGLVLSASSDSVSVLIRALAARRTLRVLSRPQVTTLDNQDAQIQVGQIVPVVDGVTITAQGIVNPTIIRDPAGIILTVRPRISPEGEIVMVVAAEKSRYNPNDGVPIFTDPVTGSVVTAPIKDTTTATTTVKVPDGQTIILGGMITKNDQSVERKIPWLGDLPLIGNVFRYDLHEFRRTELIIFLTPRIVHNDADMEVFKQVEAGRMHFFQDDVESIHGPIFGVPPEMSMPLEMAPPFSNSSILPPAILPESSSTTNQIPTPAGSGTTSPSTPQKYDPVPVPPAPLLNMSNPPSGMTSSPDSAVYRLGDLPVD